MYLTIHITKLKLQTRFPKPLNIPHSACIHRDPGFESSCYDYGRVYASDSFFNPIKQRHIVLSWVNETDMEELELEFSSFLGAC